MLKKPQHTQRDFIKTYEITSENYNTCDDLERYIQIFENDLIERPANDHGILDGANEVLYEWIWELIDQIEANKLYFLKLKRNKKK